MFTFHKPKVFRSANGCCICKAKSSSSRFTDSKRYEHSFDKCFLLEIHRSGEICNACVLLVKRFLKLPKGSQRNWAHVVDARSGPGIKSVGRNKSGNKGDKNSDNNGLVDTPEKVLKRKHVYKRKRAQRKPNKSTIRRRVPDQKENFDIALTLDPSYWTKETICCGVIYVGKGGETAVDTRTFRPCCTHQSLETGTTTTTTTPTTTATDSNSEVEEKVIDILKTKAAENNMTSESTTATQGSSRAGSDVDEGFFDRPVASPSSGSLGTRSPAPSEEDSNGTPDEEEESVEEEEVDDEEEDIEDEEEMVVDDEDEEDEEEIDDNEEQHLQAMEAT